MPREHEHDPLYSLSIKNMVFHRIIVSREKNDHYYFQTWTAQQSFFLLQSYCTKTLRKSAQKVLVNTKLNVLMSPGHPIILPKYNLFNMVAVLVKRSFSLSIRPS